MGSGPSTTQNGTTSQVSNQSPWAPQVPYLKNAFSQAQDAYDKNMAAGPYTGDYVAAPNQDQYDQNGNAINFANGAGANAVTGQLGAGSTLTGMGIGASGAGIAGLQGATGPNALGNTIQGAQQVASGFDVPGAVSAAMQSANQEAADNTLPSLYRGAAAGGNINSDRTALATGVVQRGLAQQAAGLSAQLQNQNYQTGLTTAQNQNQQTIQGNSALLNGGNQSSSVGNTATTSGMNSEATNAALGSGAANANQQLDQSTLNNALAQWTGNQNFDYNNLNSLMQIISGKYGGTTTTNGTTSGTTQTNPSLLQNLSSGAGILGSLI